MEWLSPLACEVALPSRADVAYNAIQIVRTGGNIFFSLHAGGHQNFMPRTTLRQNIAAEAARLLLKKQAVDLFSARKKAARFFSRKRLLPGQLPTLPEIQEQVLALSGHFERERGNSLLLDLRMTAAELMESFPEMKSLVTGDLLTESVRAGAEITLLLGALDFQPVLDRLDGLGVRYLHWEDASGNSVQRIGYRGTVQGIGKYPVVVHLYEETAPVWQMEDPDQQIALADLQRLIALDTPGNLEEETDFAGGSMSADEEYHPELRSLLQMYLQGLESVKLDPRKHPEGDALYHSLQVFELGRESQPYDEEFLLACLIHDIGLGLDRHHPQRALKQALGPLLTERIRFLLEHHARGIEYLSTGSLPASLRKSEHFDDLLLLARCDLDGRLRGAQVPSLEEAIEYIFSLSRTWDEHALDESPAQKQNPAFNE